MNALDLSQSMPQPPQPNQQGGQQPSAQPGQGVPGQGVPGGQKPAPTHAQTVAALRHFSAFERMYAGLQKNVGLGKSDIKSSTIDGVTKLVADRFISPAQAVMLLGSFPTDPKEQRKWISDHYAKDRQAEDAILDHHRAAHKGTQDHDFESQMETSDPDNHMDDLSGMMGAHYAGNGPSGDEAIQAKQQLRGFAEGGRPNVGEDVVVGENGPEVIRMDQPGTVIPNNALFMQSGQYPTPPWRPQMGMNPPRSALAGYENIDPNELAMMRHREMVHPSAGRGDFTPEHLANMVHGVGLVGGAPALVRGAMMAAPYLSAEGVAGHFASRAPAAAIGGLAATYAAAPTAAGEQPFRWQDPNEGRAKRLEQINNQLLENATKQTKSAPGTQKALSDSLNAEKNKLMDAQNGEQADAFKRWQDEQQLAAEQAAERKRAETSIFDVIPGTRQAMAIGAPIAAAAGGYGLGRKLGPWGGMAAGAFGGGLEGAASIFGPTEIDYRGLPRGAPAQQQSAADLSDFDWYKRAAAITAMNAGFGAMGGFKGGMSRRGVLPMSTAGGGAPNPLSATGSGPMIPGGPTNALAATPQGQSLPTAAWSPNALAASSTKVVPIEHELPDGKILRTFNYKGKLPRYTHDGRRISAEQANALRNPSTP